MHKCIFAALTLQVFVLNQISIRIVHKVVVVLVAHVAGVCRAAHAPYGLLRYTRAVVSV